MCKICIHLNIYLSASFNLISQFKFTILFDKINHFRQSADIKFKLSCCQKKYQIKHVLPWLLKFKVLFITLVHFLKGLIQFQLRSFPIYIENFDSQVRSRYEREWTPLLTSVYLFI